MGAAVGAQEGGHDPTLTSLALPIYFAAFVTGAIVMSFEMLGSRYLAPYFGGGIYTWASLISTVLAALCVGYFLGGYLADRYPSPIVLGATVFVGFRLSVAFTGLRRTAAASPRMADRRHQTRQPRLGAGNHVLSGHISRHVFALWNPSPAALEAAFRRRLGKGLWYFNRRQHSRDAWHHILLDPPDRIACD